MSQEVRGEGDGMVDLVSVWDSGRMPSGVGVIGVIVIGEIFLLAMLGLRGSERREERA